MMSIIVHIVLAAVAGGLIVGVVAELRRRRQEWNLAQKELIDAVLHPEEILTGYVLVNYNTRKTLGMPLSDRFSSVAFEREVIMQYVDIKALRKATHAMEYPMPHRPPELGEYLLYFLPKQYRESFIGDLEEEFHQMCTKFGLRKANIWYYVQVGSSFWPLLKAVLRRLIKWGILTWLGEIVRRRIGG